MSCCPKCFVPEHDELRPPEYMVSEAVPESCKDEECECHVIRAIDINVPTDIPVKSEGVAYYRLPDHLFEFLKLCQDKHGILGFEWRFGERNFGIILRNPRKDG